MKKLLLLITGLLLLFSVEGQILRYSNYTAPPEEPSGDNDFLTNLVAYWRLEESSGTLDDAVGTNNSTLCDAVYGQTGKVGNCLLFVSANSDYVQIADAAELQMYDQDFTMVAWVNLTNDVEVGEDQYIIGGENSAAGMSVYNNSINTFLRLHFIANYDEDTGSTATLSSGTWYFVAIVFDSNTTTNNVMYYVNSTTNLVTFNYDFGSGNGSNIIGARRSSSNFFDGLIDEVAIWKGRKLTEDELDDLYNSGDGRAFSYLE